MKSVVISPDHGMLFVLDPTNKEALVPEYIDNQTVAATDFCISVATRAYVDGDVEVTLASGATSLPGLQRVSTNSLVIPNGILAIITSDLAHVLESEVAPGRVTVSIWVDSPINAARVGVIIDASSAGTH